MYAVKVSTKTNNDLLVTAEAISNELALRKRYWKAYVRDISYWVAKSKNKDLGDNPPTFEEYISDVQERG